VSTDMLSTTTEAAPEAKGIPEMANAIVDWRKKRQRHNHTPLWQQYTRALSQAVDSRQNLDADQSN